MGDRQAFRQLAFELDDMIAEECRRSSLVDLAGGNHHEQLNDVRLLGFDTQSIEIKKKIGCGKRGTLVAVDEWVVLGDAEKISGGQFTEIGSPSISLCCGL
jgi:hypothetical protein